LLGLFDNKAAHKELAEQIQVGTVHEKTGNNHSIIDCTGWITLVVLVTKNGNDAPSDHLCYLHKGNPHGIEPLGLHFHCHEEVVSIHDSMDGKIHGSHVNTNGRGVGVSVPSVQKYSDVMVPVQEQDLLLVNYQEERIN